MGSKIPLFSEGSRVEITSDEPGFLGAWFEVTICQVDVDTNRALVDYERFVDENDPSKPHREVVDLSHVRPRPPRRDDTLMEFQGGDVVEAFVLDGWWVGEIREVLDNSTYLVRFPEADDWEVPRTNLRPRLDWVQGKWNSPAVLEIRQEEVKGTRKRGRPKGSGKRRKDLQKNTEKHISGGFPSDTLAIARLLEEVHQSKIDDPVSYFDDKLKKIALLECHGNDVQFVRAHMAALLRLKRIKEQCFNKVAELEVEILNQKHGIAAINTEIDRVGQDLSLEKSIHKQEHPVGTTILGRIACLENSLTKLMLQREFGIIDVSRLKKEVQLIKEKCRNCRSDFDRVAAAPMGNE